MRDSIKTIYTARDVMRGLGDIQAMVEGLGNQLTLLEWQAERAPTKKQFAAVAARGSSFMFHHRHRESYLMEASGIRRRLQDAMVLLNDLHRHLFPERLHWDKAPSDEMIAACREADLSKQIADDQAQRINLASSALARNNKRVQRIKNSGINALFKALS